MPRAKLCDCGECKRCKHRAYMAAWSSRNREWVRAKERERRHADPEKMRGARARASAWYHANTERAKERSRNRYHETKELTGRPSGEAHHLWKGDEVGYVALHRWLERERGKPLLCEFCGTTTAKRFEWANRDHKYRRSQDDWLRLCTSCHRRYDYENGLARKGGRKPKPA